MRQSIDRTLQKSPDSWKSETSEGSFRLMAVLGQQQAALAAAGAQGYTWTKRIGLVLCSVESAELVRVEEYPVSRQSMDFDAVGRRSAREVLWHPFDRRF
jgi:hypothetical protein